MKLQTDIIDKNKDLISYIKNYCRVKNKRIDSLKITSSIVVPTYLAFKIVPEFDSIFSVEALIFVVVIYSISFLLIYFVKNDNLLSMKSGQEIFRLSKAVLVNILTKSIDKRINYYPTRKMLNDPIRESKLFNPKIAEVHGSDLFSLEIGHNHIEFSFVKLFVGMRTDFSGIFIHIENINTELMSEKIKLMTQKNKWSVNLNEAFVAIPMRIRNPLTIELNGKENNLDKILKEISIVFEIFSFFEAITNVKYEPITEEEKDELLGNQLSNFKVNPQKFAFGVTRMMNFMIDSIVIAILAFLFCLFSLIVLGIFAVNPPKEIFAASVFFVIYFAYYLYFESKFGKTIGKLFTKTKVVDLTNQKPSIKRIFIRTLTRLIPFDVYTFLDDDVGWHDSLSKTRVIYENEKSQV